MTTDIFIRTCAKDIAWLRFAIASIRSRVSGYRHLVITCPVRDVARVARATGEHVIGVQAFVDDYIGQQHTKLTATDHTDADVICFWDSDTMAAEAIDLNSLLFGEGGLVLHRVPFAGLADGSEIWRSIVTRDMGFEPEYESMRRLPLAYHRKTLLDCKRHIERTHDMPLRAYMLRLPQRSFSEFNCLGAWIEANETHLYDLRINEGEAAMWKKRVRQFWSWGGITPQVLDELHSIGLA
jgi:hypothetical protein